MFKELKNLFAFASLSPNYLLIWISLLTQLLVKLFKPKSWGVLTQHSRSAITHHKVQYIFKEKVILFMPH